MAVSGNVGLTSIVDVDCCIHDGFIALLNLREDFNPIFLREYLELIRQVNQAKSSGAIWKNLTTNEIKAIRVQQPPLKLQNIFLDFTRSLAGIKDRQSKSANEIQALYSSVISQAFKGELA